MVDDTMKQISHAFERDCFYLGVLDGNPVWLEGEMWACDWYWACGYVESYTNKWSPNKARDVDCHQHIDGLFRDCPFWDMEKGEEKLQFLTPHLTQGERYKLGDLFKSMYALKEAAGVIGRGGSHITTVESFGPDKDMAAKINQDLLPPIFAAIKDILSPDFDLTESLIKRG